MNLTRFAGSLLALSLSCHSSRAELSGPYAPDVHTVYLYHQFDPSATFNNRLWIGRRTLGSSQWKVFKHPTYTANDITDGHDVISFGIDGNGFMHLSWGMHGDEFHYAKRQLHFLYQASGGLGYTAPSNLASRISVLEWDAAA